MVQWNASVLTGVTSDTEPCLLVTFENAKYLFNAGENTTRSFLQTGRRWNHARGIFLTDVNTSRASGLPGLLMSLADAKSRQLTIAGPPGLMHWLASARTCTYREGICVHPVEAAMEKNSEVPNPIYKDGNITLYSFLVHPQSVPHTSIEQRPPSDQNSRASKRKRTPSPTSKSSKRSTPLDRVVSGDTPMKGVTSSLRERMKQPQFNPSTLTGTDAQEWRYLLIKGMFPQAEPLPDPKIVARRERKAKHEAKKRSKQGSTGKGKEESQDAAPAPDAKAALSPSTAIALQPAPRPPPRLPKYDRQLPLYTSSKAVLAYVLVGPQIRGKFDAEKAQELGIPNGPVRRQLAAGETVTFRVKDGNGQTTERTVTSEEVLGKAEHPKALLVLDIPDSSYIPNLVSTFADSTWLMSIGKENRPMGAPEIELHAVFHICGEGVLEDERYKTFMGILGGPRTQHIIASRGHTPDPVSFTTAAYNILRLNQLDSGIFPIPKFAVESPKTLDSVLGLPQLSHPLQANIDINMHPSRDPVHVPTPWDLFHPALVGGDRSNLVPASLSHLFSQARAAVREREAFTTASSPGDDVQVISLGTGSASPSQSRNVSGTLVRIPGYGSVLLDAGEATWGQLARHHGTDKAASNNVWDVLRDLRCIFISHIHGDHHMGLGKILAMRQKLDPPATLPLYLIAGRAVHLYLREQSDIEDYGLTRDTNSGVKTILPDWIDHFAGPYRPPVANEGWTARSESEKALRDLQAALGIESLRTVMMEHRCRCFGLVMKHRDGWSLAYSGDTMPCNRLVEAGKNATLLIHEATMADEEAELAFKKAHSTVGQALDVATRMNAKNVYLTHFSCRYPKMPHKNVNAQSSPSRGKDTSDGDVPPVVALAFDNVSVRIGDMWKLAAFRPAIEQNYADTEQLDAESGTLSPADPDVDVAMDS